MTGEKYHFTKTPTPDLWSILMAAKHLYTHLKREKDKCSSSNIKEVMDCHSSSRGIPVGLVGNHHVDVKKEEKSFKWKHILKFLIMPN